MGKNIKAELVGRSVSIALGNQNKLGREACVKVVNAACTIFDNLSNLGVSNRDKYALMNILMHTVSYDLAKGEKNLEQSIVESILTSAGDKIQSLMETDEYVRFTWAYEKVNDAVDCEDRDNIVNSPDWRKRAALAIQKFKQLELEVEICDIPYGTRDELLRAYSEAKEDLGTEIEVMESYLK